jgi:hypothetical protein
VRALELDDPTRAALDAGTKDIFRELTDSAARETMGLMARSRGNRLVALRQGLGELRARLPECEEKLFALYLGLGVCDATAIGDRVVKEFNEIVPGVAESLANALRGPQRPAALRQAMSFKAEVAAHASGVPGRALVAVELHRRQGPTIVKVMENRELPKSRTFGLAELLGHAEQPWLDWKREFPPGLLPGTKHPDREAYRGKLLKSLVSIANSIADEHGYLVYGVDDGTNPRKVAGVDRIFDDAEFQDWNHKAFSPPVQFQFRYQDFDGKLAAIFDIVPSSDYPHVCAQDAGTELRAGQVWFRRGSRNTLAEHADLKRMFAPQEPLRTEQNDGALVRAVRELWEPQGWQLVWGGVNDRDEKLALGWRIAYAPESRREIRLSHSNADVHILMLRHERR